ncbi:MAG: metal-sulfur cluster assembly factor [Thermoleophilia bacterium]|nr:metal-sulfur cluster assembly factor [Thermoleophilia bacterium]
MATKTEVLDALKDIIDPELGVNVVDLGLVYDVDVREGEAFIRMTLTSIGCPIGTSLAEGVRSGALRAPGLKDAHVEVVFDPPWTPERMSETARTQLRWK